mgnify:CR=1 FL=1
MIIKNKTIDGGKGFDWGRVSSEYAKYRDIYPQEFYQKILDLGLCKDGQMVLDLEPVSCQETCILTGRSGLAQIFRKNKSGKHKSYLKGWISITM